MEDFCLGIHTFSAKKQRRSALLKILILSNWSHHPSKQDKTGIIQEQICKRHVGSCSKAFQKKEKPLEVFPKGIFSRL